MCLFSFYVYSDSWNFAILSVVCTSSFPSEVSSLDVVTFQREVNVRYKMSALWRWYSRIVDKYPWGSQIVQTGVLCAAGDVIAQVQGGQWS